MPTERHDQPDTTTFPAGLSKPALRALAAAGYARLDQLTTVGEADLARLHGMGPKALGSLREALAARGLSFADPADAAGDPHATPPPGRDPG